MAKGDKTTQKTATKKTTTKKAIVVTGNLLGRDDFSEEDYQAFVRAHTYDAREDDACDDKAGSIQVRIAGVLAGLAVNPALPEPVRALAREADSTHVEAVLQAGFDDPNELGDEDLGLYALSAAREIAEKNAKRGTTTTLV